MNKTVYSISGKDNTGVKKEIFKAGFNASNNPSVTIGELEVDLANSSIVPNPTLEGGEAKLNSIQIGPTKYEVGGSGGGLPTPANAGDAMVYNGTEWAKQSGYGYFKAGTGQEITWNGELDGHETWDVPTAVFNLVKISDLVPTSAELVGNRVRLAQLDETGEETRSLEDIIVDDPYDDPPEHGHYYMPSMSDMPCLLVIDQDTTMEGKPLTAGIWSMAGAM